MPGIALDDNFLNALLWIVKNLYIVIFIIGFLMFIATYKIFDNERIFGWRALVPVYNTMTLYKVVNLPAWFGIILWIPVINFSAIYLFPLLSVNLARKYHKDLGYGILMSILPFVFYPLLVYRLPNLNKLLKKDNTVIKSAVIVGTEPEIIDIDPNIQSIPEISNVEDVNIEYQASEINPYEEPVEEEIEITVNKTPMDLLYEMPELSMGNSAVSLKKNTNDMKVEELVKPKQEVEK